MKINVSSVILISAWKRALAAAIAIPSGSQHCHKALNGSQHCGPHHPGNMTFPGQISGTPFHDCLGGGGSWHECRLAIQNLTVTIELDKLPMIAQDTIASASNSTLEERSVTVPSHSTISGILNDFGISFGQSEECYSVAKLGGTGWLTNTAVRGLEQAACTAAVTQALSPVSGKLAGLGYFTKTLSGFYQANGGPIVKPDVGFYLSTLFQGDYMDLAAAGVTDLNKLGVDLCMKGIEHLITDSGCTAKRRAGKTVEHISVNGGEFNYGHDDGTKAGDSTTPSFDASGACTNCIFSMFMEAANKVDKTGTAAVPEDKSS